MIAGTVLGTYLAGFIFKSTEVIDDKSESLEDLVKDSIEKGKDFIEDLKQEDSTATEINEQDQMDQNDTDTTEEAPAKKSARERLKDKGYLK